MTDEDFFGGWLSTGEPGPLAEVTFASLEAWAAYLTWINSKPVPSRIELTEGDYKELLSRFPQEPQFEGACKPLASLRGLPIFYAEESAVVYSDGSRAPLR